MSMPSVESIPSHLRDSLSTDPVSIRSAADKYRGACIADLDLPPALSVPPTIPIAEALALSYDRSYDQLTVISETNRALMGYVSIPRLKSLLETNQCKEDDTIKAAMTMFRKSKGVQYQIISPDTSLEDLEEFLTRGRGKEVGFAVVTDTARKFVLGVVTNEDLDKFATRRAF